MRPERRPLAWSERRHSPLLRRRLRRQRRLLPLRRTPHRASWCAEPTRSTLSCRMHPSWSPVHLVLPSWVPPRQTSQGRVWRPDRPGAARRLTGPSWGRPPGRGPQGQQLQVLPQTRRRKRAWPPQRRPSLPLHRPRRRMPPPRGAGRRRPVYRGPVRRTFRSSPRRMSWPRPSRREPGRRARRVRPAAQGSAARRRRRRCSPRALSWADGRTRRPAACSRSAASRPPSSAVSPASPRRSAAPLPARGQRRPA